MNTNNYVTCPICNKELKIITNTHILSHSMSVEEFKTKYPGQKLISDSVINRLNFISIKGNSIKRTANTLEERKQIYSNNPKKCLCCNNILSYEKRKRKFCDINCAAKINNIGRPHTNDCKERMGIIVKQNYDSGKRIKQYRKVSKIEYKNCKICGKLYIISNYKKFYKHVCCKTCDYVFRKNNGINLSNRFKNQKTYKQCIFNSKYYGEVKLDSKWEVLVVESLEHNDIKWQRGKSFEWTRPSDNTVHRYFPDFYLPDYDIYVEPKNPYKWKTDYNFEKYKINYVIKHHNIIVVMILDSNHANWEYIKTQIPLAV